MKITLYYFSATGNSMTTAQRIAQEMGDCQLVPVASTKSLSKVLVETEAVGLVFPVYYGNMPWPVREMISKMVFPAETYCFLFTTWRGHAGDVAKRADQLLHTRGQKLSLAMGIPMPGNSFINAPEVDEDHLAKQQAHILEQLEALKAGTVNDYATTEVLRQVPVDYPNNFRGITADENCVGCGTCVKVCPMGNIAIKDGRAVIGDDCATCLSCFHWCPVEAIWMSQAENIARRSKYRHPDVTVDDIAAQLG